MNIDDYIEKAKPYTNTNDLGTLTGAFGIGAANMANNAVFGGGGQVLGLLGRGVEWISPWSGDPLTERDRNMLDIYLSPYLSPEEIDKIDPYEDSWLTSAAKGTLDIHNAIDDTLTDWRQQLLGDNPTLAARIAEGAGSSMGFMGLGALGAGVGDALGAASFMGIGEALTESGGFMGDAYKQGRYREGLDLATKNFIVNAALNTGLNFLFSYWGKGAKKIASKLPGGVLNPYVRYGVGTLTETLNELLQEPSQQVIEQASLNALNNGTGFLPELGESVKQWPEIFAQLAPEVTGSTLLTQGLFGAGAISTKAGRQNIRNQYNISKFAPNAEQSLSDNYEITPEGLLPLYDHDVNVRNIKDDDIKDVVAERDKLLQELNDTIKSGNYTNDRDFQQKQIHLANLQQTINNYMKSPEQMRNETIARQHEQAVQNIQNAQINQQINQNNQTEQPQNFYMTPQADELVQPQTQSQPVDLIPPVNDIEGNNTPQDIQTIQSTTDNVQNNDDKANTVKDKKELFRQKVRDAIFWGGNTTQAEAEAASHVFMQEVNYFSNYAGLNFDVTADLLQTGFGYQDEVFDEVTGNKVKGNVSFKNGVGYITFSKMSNPSTILHETAGHRFLKAMEILARSGQLKGRALQDWNTVTKNYKINDIDFSQSLSDIEQSRLAEAHENFATDVEHYFWTGEAPNSKLKHVFENFKRWLKRIYSALSDIEYVGADGLKHKHDYELSPAMKELFDVVFGDKVASSSESEVNSAQIEQPQNTNLTQPVEETRTSTPLPNNLLQQMNDVRNNLLSQFDNVFTNEDISEIIGRINEVENIIKEGDIEAAQKFVEENILHEDNLVNTENQNMQQGVEFIPPFEEIKQGNDVEEKSTPSNINQTPLPSDIQQKLLNEANRLLDLYNELIISQGSNLNATFQNDMANLLDRVNEIEATVKNGDSENAQRIISEIENKNASNEIDNNEEDEDNNKTFDIMTADIPSLEAERDRIEDIYIQMLKEKEHSLNSKDTDEIERLSLELDEIYDMIESRKFQEQYPKLKEQEQQQSQKSQKEKVHLTEEQEKELQKLLERKEFVEKQLSEKRTQIKELKQYGNISEAIKEEGKISDLVLEIDFIDEAIEELGKDNQYISETYNQSINDNNQRDYRFWSDNDILYETRYEDRKAREKHAPNDGFKAIVNAPVGTQFTVSYGWGGDSYIEIGQRGNGKKTLFYIDKDGTRRQNRERVIPTSASVRHILGNPLAIIQHAVKHGVNANNETYSYNDVATDTDNTQKHTKREQEKAKSRKQTEQNKEASSKSNRLDLDNRFKTMNDLIKKHTNQWVISNGETYNQLIGREAAQELDMKNGNNNYIKNLGKAELMSKAGKDEQTIWLATGWWKAPDGKWRMDLQDGRINKRNLNKLIRTLNAYEDLVKKNDDALHNLNYSVLESHLLVNKIYKSKKYKHLTKQLNEEHYLHEVYNNPILFDAYPSFNNIKFEVRSYPNDDVEGEDVNGEFIPSTNTIVVNKNLSADEIRKVFIHEIQHAVQEIEGFAEGGDSTLFEDSYKKYINKKDRLNKEINRIYKKAPDLKQQLKQLNSQLISEFTKKGISQSERHDYYEKTYIPERTKLENASPYAKELQKLREQIETLEKERMQKYSNIEKDKEAEPYELYRRLGGEIDARLAADMANLTKTQRKKNVPSKFMDVDKSEWHETYNQSIRSKVSDEQVTEIYNQIGKKRKAEMDKALTQHRTDLTPEQRKIAINEIEKLGEQVKEGGSSKHEKAAIKWLIGGHIILPEDNYKIIDAIKISEQQRFDPMQYDDPNEILAKYTIKETKLSERINPDDIPEFSNKIDYGNGLVVYDVEDNKAGQKAVRSIVDTHWGEKANPWCLVARMKEEDLEEYRLEIEYLGDYWDGDKGDQINLLSEAWKMWNSYNSIGKRIAFKDGKLLAFCASSENKTEWWDRKDISFDGIPYTEKRNGVISNFIFNEKNKSHEKISETLPDGTEREYKDGYLFIETFSDGTQKRYDSKHRLRLLIKDNVAHMFDQYGNERKTYDEAFSDLLNPTTNAEVSDEQVNEIYNQAMRSDASELNVKEQLDAVRKQYEGTDKWLKAPNGKTSKLNEKQWHQVRTPNFKRWFGDWEAVAEAANPRTVNSISEAGELIRSLDILNKDIENSHLNITAQISGKGLAKMQSEKATKKSITQKLHALAIANIDRLFKSATLELKHSDSHGRNEVEQVRRLGTVMLEPETGQYIPVMLTLIEYQHDGKKIYSVEAVDVVKYNENSAGQSTALAQKQIQVPITEFVNKIANLAQTVKNTSSKVLDENGEPLVVYHGTGRADRVGSVFRKDRATSGPMVFFTDSLKIAEKYSKEKADTSLSRENLSDYENQFVIETKTKNGKTKEIPIVDYWDILPISKRKEIATLAPTIGFDDEAENIISIPDNKIGAGGYEWHFREAKGNHLKALVEEWLNSGNLYNKEERFLDVLKLAGLDNVKYKDPNYREEAVYDVYLNMKNPFDTSNISESDLKALERSAIAAQRHFNLNNSYNADYWDKSNREPQKWMEQLKKDIQKGTTTAWTSIPDWVTNRLKKLGYDGIKDTGGKFHPDQHNIYIPFEPTDIKSATKNNGNFNSNDPEIYHQTATTKAKERNPYFASKRSFLNWLRRSNIDKRSLHVPSAENELSNDNLRFENEITEQRYSEATKGVQKPTLTQRIKLSTHNILKSFRSPFSELANDKDLLLAKNLLEQLARKQSLKTQESMNSFVQNIKSLSSNQRNLFARKRLLDDLMWRKTQLPDADLPFGFDDEMLKREYERFTKLTEKNKPVIEAIKAEENTMKNISDEFASLAKDLGLNLDNAFKNPHYYRHAILEYANAATMGRRNGGANSNVNSAMNNNDNIQSLIDEKLNDIRNRNFLKRYKGSTLDISTNYIQANGEVRTQMLMDIEIMKTLKEIKEKYDKASSLRERLRQVFSKKNNTYSQGEGLNLSDVIPEGYSLYNPAGSRLIQSANTATENVIAMALDDASEQSGIPLDEMLNSMENSETLLNQLWVIPTNLKESLKNLARDRDRGILGNSARFLTNWWKLAVLFTPTRVLKYNFRNFTGDLDAVIAGRPDALRYFGQAVRELTALYRGGNTTQDLNEYIERAGGLNIESMQLSESDLNSLQNLATETSKNPFVRGARGTWNAIRSFFQAEASLTQWREHLLRYAAYLSYKQDMDTNNGTPSTWGASIKDEIMALDDNRDKAFKLSNELLGDYQNISDVGKQLRDFAIPFWSWLEMNAKRYYRLLKNGFNGDNSSDFTKRLLIGQATRMPFYALSAAETFGKIALFTMLVQSFNRFFFGDDDDELPEDVKYRPHLTLGKINGKVYYFDRIGALADNLDWLNLDNIFLDAKQLANGQQSLGNYFKKMAQAPVSKVINSLNPIITMPIELATGRSMYPDAFNSRTIKDNGKYIASSFGLTWPYKAITGEPRNDWDELSNLLVYSLDPDEAAYWQTLDKVRQFQNRVLDKHFDGFASTKRGQVLQKLKMALRYNDRAAVRRYLKDYAQLDGTKKGLKQSMLAMNPLHGLSKDEKKKFLKWITADDRKYLKKADRYYHKLADKYVK